MIRTQRTVISLEMYGYTYIEKLKELFINDGSYKDIKYYNDVIDYLFKETIQQVFVIIDDPIDFPRRLLNSINWEMFKHMTELNDHVVREKFINMFKEFGLQLFFLIERYTGNLPRESEKILVAAKPEFIVIDTYIKGQE